MWVFNFSSNKISRLLVAALIACLCILTGCGGGTSGSGGFESISVRGILTDANGNPVANQSVDLEALAEFKTVVTSSAGIFETELVAQQDEFITVAVNGFATSVSAKIAGDLKLTLSDQGLALVDPEESEDPLLSKKEEKKPESITPVTGGEAESKVNDNNQPKIDDDSSQEDDNFGTGEELSWSQNDDGSVKWAKSDEPAPDPEEFCESCKEEGSVLDATDKDILPLDNDSRHPNVGSTNPGGGLGSDLDDTSDEDTLVDSDQSDDVNDNSISAPAPGTSSAPAPKGGSKSPKSGLTSAF